MIIDLFGNSKIVIPAYAGMTVSEQAYSILQLRRRLVVGFRKFRTEFGMIFDTASSEWAHYNIHAAKDKRDQTDV